MYKNKKTDKSTKKEKKIILEKSNKKDKRFKVTMKNFPNMEDHSHHFGSKGGKSYIDSRTDKEKRKNYRARHKGDLDTKDYKRAGYLSYYLLWGDNKSLKKNIKDLEKKLNAKIIYKS